MGTPYTAQSGESPVSALLRDRTRAGSGRVGMVELFFDLVFVFAVTQLSHTLLADLTLENLVRVARAVARGVVGVDRTPHGSTNWLDPERMPVRICLFVLMLVGSVPVRVHSAVVRRSRARVRGRVRLMQVGRTLFFLWAVRGASRSGSRNLSAHPGRG